MAVNKIVIMSIKKNSLDGGVSTIINTSYEELRKQSDVRLVSLFDDKFANPKYEWDVLVKKHYVWTNVIWHLKTVLFQFLRMLPIFYPSLKKSVHKIANTNDIIVVHDPFCIPFIPKKRSSKIVFNLHGQISLNNIYGYMVRIMLYLYASKIDVVLLESKKDFEILDKHSNIKATFVNNYSLVDKVPLKFNHNNRFIYFGRIHVGKQKRIEKIIEWANANEFYVDFYGKNYEDFDLKTLDKGNFCTFDYRFYDINEMKNKFNNYVALLNYSKYEGQPFAVVDAIKIGLPIISLPQLAGVNEIINDECIDIEDIPLVNKMLNDKVFRQEVYLKQSVNMDKMTLENYLLAILE